MQTNDFFVSTWNRNDGDGILQFKGFAPGLSIPVVTENIKNEMQIALDILFGARRKLKLQVKTDQSESKYFRGHSRDPCEKANSNTADGLPIAAEKCIEAEKSEWDVINNNNILCLCM